MICSAALCDIALMSADPQFPHERLAWARERAGFSDKAEFAKAVGINPVTYRAYESGQNGFAKLAAQFGKKLGVTAEWLIEGGSAPDRAADATKTIFLRSEASPSEQSPTLSIDVGEVVEISRLDLSLPMGPGATVDDFVESEPLKFDLGYVRSFTRTPPHRLRLAGGAGDSMFPTLVPNDLVWIDTTQNQLLHADRIYAASINGGAAIKRLRPVAGGRRVLVISDNKTVDPYEVDAEEVVIWGRVIRFARDL